MLGPIGVREIILIPDDIVCTAPGGYYIQVRVTVEISNTHLMCSIQIPIDSPFSPCDWHFTTILIPNNIIGKIPCCCHIKISVTIDISNIYPIGPIKAYIYGMFCPICVRKIILIPDNITCIISCCYHIQVRVTIDISHVHANWMSRVSIIYGNFGPGQIVTTILIPKNIIRFP